MTAAVEGHPEHSVRPSPAHRTLYGHGYALVLSSALTSAIGLLFWVVAARGYDQAALGRNSALIAAIMFLAGLAQLNLLNVLIRFVPVAGPRAVRLVALAYLVGGGLAGLAGLGFALGIRWWAPELGELVHGPAQIAGTAAACAVWAIFVMQDGVLTAVGRARLVPVENLVFSVLKLGLLAGLAAALPAGGITVSWMAATAAAVLATTAYLFVRALPAHQRAGVPSERISVRSLAGYLGGDFLGATCWLACTQLLPVLVLGSLGARPTAVFSVAWTIAYALYLVPAAMGQSLVAHAAGDAGRAAAARRGIERRSLLLLAPAVAALIVAGPWALRLLGSGYADAGRWVLIPTALSALPNVVVAAAVSEARVQRRVGVVASLLATLSVLVLTLALTFMPIIGIAGVGLALLAGQSVVAAGVWIIRRGRVPRPISGPFAARRSRALLRRVAPAALGPLSWRIQGRLHGRSDSAVAPVGPPDRSTGLLKAAATEEGQAALLREAKILARLKEDPRLSGWNALVPAAIDSGRSRGAVFSLQELMPGRDSRSVVAGSPARAEQFSRAAFAALADLHDRTAELVRVEDRLLRQHVAVPAELVRAAVPARLRTTVDRVAAGLSARLRERRLPAGWVHGDYSPDNILLGPDDRVSGIVDWAQGTDHGLVAIDVLSLALSTEVTATGRELGPVVVGWLATGPPAAALLHDRSVRGGDEVPVRALVLLGWLHLVGANLSKSARYAANPIWLRRNVFTVLSTRNGAVP
ncbi:aminoglycoside phosphotransferase family protein [Amycolatopsis orientalis]|uniref:aminoglycoside phosphotransferase family protein n=1 Tax=Amycolatopsis orientalis TaxID=31958 RepID=UPI0003A53A53|nr:aminoglycoside phosphotransferase family protein [Amycolatopsis orientalis]